jgi:3-deoxy-7-phosphoheptulonate synthase
LLEEAVILVFRKDVSPKQKNQVQDLLVEKGFIVKTISAGQELMLGAVGKDKADRGFLENLPEVDRIIPIEAPYKLVGRHLHPEDSLVRVGDVTIGGECITIIAGPCAVESREQALAIAWEVKRYGAVLFRGGAFKPRTSPYSFQGLEEEGLIILSEVREATGLGIVSEIISPSHAELVAEHVDMVQVGARSMQNFELLKCVGRMDKPVLLKRGFASTIEEWLMSAEYILAAGNENVVLCERGIRTFEPYTRNTLDLSAIPVLKNLTHLPVIIDPSHATGIREKVSPMARAAVAAGADGLMIEVHNEPDKALSDGPQSLLPKQFGQLTREIYVIAPVVGKQLDFDYLDKKKPETFFSKANATSWPSVAFLGEQGTFSHKASLQFFDEQIEPLALPTFRGIFDAVKLEQADYGVVPLENSLTGSIHENYDLLLEYDLTIVGEIMLRIVHNLIGLRDASIETIERVFAPPQAFQQCRQFLERTPAWEYAPVNATANAVRVVHDLGTPTNAAIGSKEAAQLYEMEILEEGIETNPRNYTRFAVLGHGPLPNGKKGKSSLIFSTGNRPGALFGALRIFAEEGINLVKLESRPIHGKPWEYMFYVDFEGDITSASLSPLLHELATKTDYMKVLGSY